MGTDAVVIENLKPKREMSHGVKVVPIFAPMMIAITAPSSISHAPKKLIASKIVAV